MAERRMFSKSVIDSDLFLNMPLSAQLLYFHLGIRADDDGFIDNPKTIGRIVGASEDDFGILFVKKYIMKFESGVIVIRHWKQHNYIRSDRYKPTKYIEEKSTLSISEHGVYSDSETLELPLGIPTVDVGKVRLGKVSIEKKKEKKPEKIKIPSYLEFKEYGLSKKPDVSEEALKLKYEAWVENGWKDGNNKPVKNWKSKLLNTIGHLPVNEVSLGIESFKDKEYLKDDRLNEMFIKYLEVRKQLRQPINEDVIKILISELKSVSNGSKKDAEQIIEKAMTNGHKTFYPLKD